MTLRDVLVPLFLTLLAPAAHAQEPEIPALDGPRHLIGFSSGLTLEAVRDEIISPLTYSGAHAPLHLTYQYRGPRTRHAILLSYGAGELTSSITNTLTGAHRITAHRAAFTYAFALRVLDIETLSSACFAGVALSGLLNLRQHYFTRGQSHTNADQMTSLGISLSTETSFPRGSAHILRSEIGVPFISYALLTDHFNANVTTTVYERNSDTDLWAIFRRGRFIWLGSLTDIRATVSYLMYVTDHLGVDLQYRLRYYAFPEYEGLFQARVVTHQFLLGLTVAL